MAVKRTVKLSKLSLTLENRLMMLGSEAASSMYKKALHGVIDLCTQYNITINTEKSNYNEVSPYNFRQFFNVLTYLHPTMPKQAAVAIETKLDKTIKEVESYKKINVQFLADIAEQFDGKVTKFMGYGGQKVKIGSYYGLNREFTLPTHLAEVIERFKSPSHMNTKPEEFKQRFAAHIQAFDSAQDVTSCWFNKSRFRDSSVSELYSGAKTPEDYLRDNMIRYESLSQANEF
jgi:hypothetical protein